MGQSRWAQSATKLTGSTYGHTCSSSRACTVVVVCFAALGIDTETVASPSSDNSNTRAIFSNMRAPRSTRMLTTLPGRTHSGYRSQCAGVAGSCLDSSSLPALGLLSLVVPGAARTAANGSLMMDVPVVVVVARRTHSQSGHMDTRTTAPTRTHLHIHLHIFTYTHTGRGHLHTRGQGHWSLRTEYTLLLHLHPQFTEMKRMELAGLNRTKRVFELHTLANRQRAHVSARNQTSTAPYRDTRQESSPCTGSLPQATIAKRQARARYGTMHARLDAVHVRS